ncbi:MAG: SufE family protein [Nitratireductor sp.]
MLIDEIIDNFEFLDDWDDRYKYLIELGNSLPAFPQEYQNDEYKVQGCVSQVWIVPAIGEGENPIIGFDGTSDAHIVRGLIAITLAIFSNKSASEILTLDETETFKKLDLSEHITPQRSNGLRSMVQRIKDTAKAAQSS